MLRDLAALARGLWNHWIALMSGVASVLAAIWLQISGKPAISSTAFWVVAAVCLVVAFVRAWRDQRRELESKVAETAQLRDELDRKTPALRVAFAFAGLVNRRLLPITVWLYNDGREPTSVADVELALDARVLVRGPGTGGHISWSLKGGGHKWLPVLSHIFHWGGAASFPIFKGSAPGHVVDLGLKAFDFVGDGPFAIWWRVATPRAVETHGAGVFRWTKEGASIDTITEAELFAIADFQWCPSQEAAWALLVETEKARFEPSPPK